MLSRLRDRLGLLLCAAGLWLLARPRRRHAASAYDRAGKLWAVLAPSECSTDADEDAAILIRRRVAHGLDPELPPGWRLEPREEPPK